MTKEEAKKFGLQLLHGIMERNESYPVYANNVKQAIDALSEESSSSEMPKDIEEAAEHYASVTDPEAHGIDFIREVFIAVAKWQKEQDDRLVDIIYQQGIEKGKDDMKEQMLKDAVEGTVTCHNLNRYILVSGLDESLTYGDKVRIIIVKED